MKKLLCAMLCFCLFVTTALTSAVMAEEGQYLSIVESAANVANATIDAAIYLDYAAGIVAGVYKWVLSDDGTYYTLAAVDEAGAHRVGADGRGDASRVDRSARRVGCFKHLL